MSTVKELADAIRRLKPEELDQLDLMLMEDDAWDRQMKEDGAAGKLDWVISEAKSAVEANKLRDTP